MKDGTVRTAGTVVAKEDIPQVGTIIRITITSMGDNYKENSSAYTTYRIIESSKNIKKASVNVEKHFFTGDEILLEEGDFTKVQMNKTTDLKYGEDYIVVEGSYKNNIKKGTASVTIKGINNYGGHKVVKFKIIPRNISGTQ